MHARGLSSICNVWKKSRMCTSPLVQTKETQERQLPKKSLELASCQTRLVASLFWHKVSAAIQDAFVEKGGIWVEAISVIGGCAKCMCENCILGLVGTFGAGGGKYGIPDLQKSKQDPTQKQEKSPAIACPELIFSLWAAVATN